MYGTYRTGGADEVRRTIADRAVCIMNYDPGIAPELFTTRTTATYSGKTVLIIGSAEIAQNGRNKLVYNSVNYNGLKGRMNGVYMYFKDVS